MRSTTLLALLLLAGPGCGTTSSTIVDDNLEHKVGSAESPSDGLVKTVSPHYNDSDGRIGTKEEYRTKDGRLVKVEITAGNSFNTYHDVITYDALGRVTTKSHVWIEDHETRKNPSAEKTRWLDTFTYFDNGYVQKTTLDNIGEEQNSSYYNTVFIELRDPKKRLVRGLSGNLTLTGVIIESNIFTFEYDRERGQRRIVNEEHIEDGRLVSTNNEPDAEGNVLYDNNPHLVYTKDVQLTPGRRLYQLRSDVK